MQTQTSQHQTLTNHSISQSSGSESANNKWVEVEKRSHECCTTAHTTVRPACPDTSCQAVNRMDL
ncbi:hypothetical protein Q5P01_021809 [Channa striata]|uniref:Uncharacterized protein n=1 Tax=Channa striata TaxID=64152 RepID=A0AA88S9R7_CHASR|nr:hypothetical protein Q5P01_021809 [Channa striata]